MNEIAKINYELTPATVSEMIKKYDNLELIPGDKGSYQEVKRVYMLFVRARTGTDKRRKELGQEAREFVNQVNTAAKELLEPLSVYEKRFKAMINTEDERESKIEQARQGELDKRMESLSNYCTVGLSYNRTAEKVTHDLEYLKSFEITEDTYQERTPDAEEMLVNGIQNTEKALADRLEFEVEQIKAEELRKRQASEAARLAKERAEFEAEQRKAKAESDAKENKAREELAARERKIQEAEDAIQAEKDKIKAVEDAKIQKAEAKQKAIADAKAAKAKLATDKKRAKLVNIDKDALKHIINKFDSLVSESIEPAFATEEATNLYLNLIAGFKAALHLCEQGREDL